MLRGPRVLALVMASALVGTACGGGTSSSRRSPLPAPPASVTAAPSDGQVTIGFSVSPGATSYNIYWSTTPGITTGSNLIAGVTNPHVHAGLTNGTTYYYAVSALNSRGESGLSIEVWAIPRVPPAPPGGVWAFGGDTYIDIGWNLSIGADSYNIYWSTSPGVTTANTQVAGVTSPHTHVGLNNGTTHYYIVTALEMGAESAPSMEVGATPLPTASCPQASVVFSGAPVSFATVTQSYDALNQGIILNMDTSTPPGWFVGMFIGGPDAGPGTTDTCTNANFFIDVFDPQGVWYLEDACNIDVSATFTQYSIFPGGCTAGTFSGSVEQLGAGSVLPITGGSFDGVRQ